MTDAFFTASAGLGSIISTTGAVVSYVTDAIEILSEELPVKSSASKVTSYTAPSTRGGGPLVGTAV